MRELVMVFWAYVVLEKTRPTQAVFIYTAQEVQCKSFLVRAATDRHGGSLWASMGRCIARHRRRPSSPPCGVAIVGNRCPP